MPLDWPKDAAGWAALLTVVAVAVWKMYLRVRRDHRIDGHERLERVAENKVAGHYEHLLKQLQAEVDRMREIMESEQKARRIAEDEATELRTRVYRLERQVHALGATPHQ